MGRPGATVGGMTSGLPYSPGVSAALDPMRRWFRTVNRYVMGPLIGAGAGPLLTTPVSGSILLLRTVGRKSGLVREAPLGYAVVNGKVVMVAGYGRQAHWFRNALANPDVEVALPGAVIAGVAGELVDPFERREAFRAVITALGTIGRVTVGDVRQMNDEEVDALADTFPVLAVTPTAVLPGPFDPGGAFPKVNLALWTAAALAGAVALAKRYRRPAH
jgi:deazaflavin-dependent oxidoreductase (nitroreductase family)